ncbi:non-specific lipid-transfer protein A-like [Malania oleifera]|uniref:non-specific lipid-transfer protein A-like n=1 Tax=Malania oleifera TaxID=397392 RepID=UPI0025ADC149|nr:non-specific lipid-transfer protein A-like [Malania oleifera]
MKGGGNGGGATVAVAVAVGLVLLSEMLGFGAAMSCTQVYNRLYPCEPFVVKGGPPAPSPACCAGMRAVKNLIPTTNDRRQACTCLKHLGNEFRDRVNFGAAALLPRMCGVEFGFPISMATMCNRIP